MKPILYLLAVISTIGLVNSSATLYGETSAQADTSQSSDWDTLFDDDQPNRDRDRPRGDGFGPPDRRQRGSEFDRGPRRGPGLEDQGYRGGGRGGYGPRDGYGRGRGREGYGLRDGYGRGRGRGGDGPRDGQRQGRGRGGQVDPQKLMDFLYKYEPFLAQKLEDLRKEDPRKVRRHVRHLSYLYAPVMRQMERDPEMGKLSLRRVRFHLRVRNQLRQSEKEGATIDSVQLRKNVAELYNVILTQEELRNHQMTVQMETWGDFEGQGKMQEGRKHLEEMEANIKAWRSNKGKIIDSHLQRLQKGVKPFPWGRM